MNETKKRRGAETEGDKKQSGAKADEASTNTDQATPGPGQATSTKLDPATHGLLQEQIYLYLERHFLNDATPHIVGWDSYLEIVENQLKDGVLDIIDKDWPGDSASATKFSDFYNDAFE